VIATEALSGEKHLLGPRDDGVSIKGPDIPPAIDVTLTYGGINSKTQESWNKYSIGGWFVTMHDTSNPPLFMLLT
jgi:hypothetical protein